MDNKLLYYIWLSIRLRPGSQTSKILLESIEDITDIYNASSKDYAAFGISPSERTRLADKNLEEAERYYNYCKSEHIGVLTYDNPYYPGRLKTIDNPPPLFYYRGRVNFLDDYPCLAMVGTRSCSENGFKIAYRTAYKATMYGAVIVNGLALGSDSACICAALDAGGYAVGLLGCGIDRIYPSQNKELFYRLSRQGLILSEFPPFSKPEGKNFPIRNRVISGISIATVILEAPEGSGAMITADHALYQGRRIFALPGDVNNSLYDGPLSLIKNGAQAITEADDILTEYSLMFPHRIYVQPNIVVPADTEKLAVDKYFVPNRSNSRYRRKSKTSPGSLSDNSVPESNQAEYNNVSSKIEKKNMTISCAKEQEAIPEKISSATFSKSTDISSSTQPSNNKDLSILSKQEIEIYSYFENNDFLTVDQIVSKGFKTDDVLSSLTMLEVYGFIEPLPGGRYQKIK